MDTKSKCYPNYDENIWLRTCKEEVIVPLPGKVSGTIPSWLNGALIRNGPGKLGFGDDTYQHLFDGSALLHRFAIKDGQVTYQCRFLESDVYKKNSEANRIVCSEFGTQIVPDPCHTIFQRIAAKFSWKNHESDNAMISVYPFGDELYALTETAFIHRVNPETLQTEKKVDISKNLAVVNHTSHPHVVEDGSVYNLAMSGSITGPCNNIVYFPAKPENAPKEYSMFEQAHIVATIPARWPLHPSYMHTFGLTENYFIIVEQPLSLSLPSLIIKGLRDQPIVDALRWYGDEMTQINVISRETGALTHKFYSKAFCYFHIINQYESSNNIILDVCSYKDAELINCLYVETMKNTQSNPDYANMFRSRPIRFVLPLLTPADEAAEGQNLIDIANTEAEAYLLPNGNVFVKPEQLCDIGCEGPRIHYERYLGKQYRYYYAMSGDVDSENPATIIKVDTVNKTALTWCEKNCYPSEPIFVPQPSPQNEDDGVVLAAIVWGGDDTNRAGLVILDAKSFLEIGRAEFQTPSPVPKGFHGWFLPEQGKV